VKRATFSAEPKYNLQFSKSSGAITKPWNTASPSLIYSAHWLGDSRRTGRRLIEKTEKIRLYVTEFRLRVIFPL
jgi:hypothetical protein